MNRRKFIKALLVGVATAPFIARAALKELKSPPCSIPVYYGTCDEAGKWTDNLINTTKPFTICIYHKYNNTTELSHANGIKMVWNRLLGIDEMFSVMKNPYQMYRKPIKAIIL